MSRTRAPASLPPTAVMAAAGFAGMQPYELMGRLFQFSGIFDEEGRKPIPVTEYGCITAVAVHGSEAADLRLYTTVPIFFILPVEAVTFSEELGWRILVENEGADEIRVEFKLL